MFHLINSQTNEVAFTGKSPTECQKYAIKNKIFKVEKSANFKHIICGDWKIERAK